MPTSTIDQRAIQSAASETDGSITEYSGRMMYGTYCLGITFDHPCDLYTFLVVLSGYNSELAYSMAQNCRTDDMGRGLVAYWKNIPFDGFTEDED